MFILRMVSLCTLLLSLSCAGAKDVSSSKPPVVPSEDTQTKCGIEGPLCFDGLQEKLDAYLDGKGKHWGEAYEFSGYVLITKDGTPIYSRFGGYANRESKSANGPDTNFRIGSVTKQFTAAAILKLQEEGKLNVEDTIDKYITDYPKQTASKITIHHLLTHTSGVPSYTDRPDLEELSKKKHTPHEIMALSWEKPLDFEPGTKYKYSNSGYVILGAIIEAASKQTYGDYIQSALFDKAGLKRTFFGDGADLNDRALGYTTSENETIELDDTIDMSVPYSAGGIRSTATDLVLWDEALKNGSVLGSEAIAQLYKPDKENYAYGWAVTVEGNHRIISHGGGINGFTTGYSRYVEDGVVIVVWSNVPNNAGAVFSVINHHLLNKPYEEPEETPVATLSMAEAETLNGGYVMSVEGRQNMAQKGVPEGVIKSLAALNIAVGENWLRVRDLGNSTFRAYASSEPKNYFTKRNSRLKFRFEQGSAISTGAIFTFWGITVPYTRDDENAKKLFKEKEKSDKADAQ